MKRLQAVLITLFNFFLLTAAQLDDLNAYDYGFDTAGSLKRQDSQRIVVSRLPSVNGTVPVRPEISQMKRDARKWNLYLLALSMMQNTNQHQDLSWYQITGIHGVPFGEWNGVPPAVGGQGGYCPHMSILFPTWHRPYLALYEQILFHLVQRIASWYPNPVERELYEAAAIEFRIPYWDWARTPADGESAFLNEFIQRGVHVDGPNGRQLIANPLYSYRFRPLEPGVFEWGDFPHWTETKRAPDANISHNELVRMAIDRVQPNLRDRLYNLLTSYQDYGPFSNKQWSESSTILGYDSLESLHDEIHIEVGNGGHLYFIQYSAFDPIFFLHHTTTDRILSLWQGLHPDAWVTEQVVTTASFTIGSGTLVNGSTPLAPFFSDPSGTFWDSDSSRHTEEFGYSYAEVSGMNRATDPVTIQNNRARLSATVNKLYGSPVVSAMLQKRRLDVLEAPDQGWLRRLARRAFKSTACTISGLVRYRSMQSPDFDTPAENDQHYTEWLANVRVETGTLNASLSVSIFLGAPPLEFKGWKAAPNIVGTVGVFSMSHMMGQSQISGTIPLTSTLLEQMGSEGSDGLHVTEAQSFLRQNLEFRVFNSDGEIQPSSVPGLCIEVVSSDVVAATYSWEFPRWSPAKNRFIMFC